MSRSSKRIPTGKNRPKAMKKRSKDRQDQSPKSRSRTAPQEEPAESAAWFANFTPTRSVEQLAAEQGVKPREDIEKLVEEFRDVWPDEAEIDEFLAALRRWRREGREDR